MEGSAIIIIAEKADIVYWVFIYKSNYWKFIIFDLIYISLTYRILCRYKLKFGKNESLKANKLYF